MRSASDDRTAVARIRDAAIEQWGQHGFNVGLRSIAEGAGVSAALVIHHFLPSALLTSLMLMRGSSSTMVPTPWL